MNKNRQICVVKTIVLALIFFNTPALATEIWYEDNNLARADGMPVDFMDKFYHPESFVKATGYIDVYMVRIGVLQVMNNEFLGKVFNNYLKKNNIRLALDVGGATLAQLKNRVKILNNEITQLKRLKELGLQVDYVSLQSALSKQIKAGKNIVDYSISKRIEDVIVYAKAVRAIYPQAAIGIIDALPSNGKAYKQPYSMLKEALAREGIKLSYIHLDIPFDIPREGWRGITWEKIREVETYVEDELGIKFGFLATSSKGGHISSKAFHERVIASLECYSGATGTPSDFIIASWFPYPQKTIPENLTNNDYPAMRTVLEFGHKLESIEKGAIRSMRQSDWRAMCTSK